MSEKLFYIIGAIIIYLCGEYLWISKILFSELDSIIKNIEDEDVLHKAKVFKSNPSINPKSLYNLHRFIESVEKTYNISTLNLKEE